MGPPHSWPYRQADRQTDYRYSVVKIIDSCRAICVKFTVAIVFVEFMLSFQYVGAGPVVFNMEYSQGPVPLARNIRHLPCISRRTAQEGLCMFAIDCLKANGTHLGTCIDRFYFGSCCQIPDKTILPILTNHIDDNSIDGASFVHPQTDKINFEFRKTTTEKAVTKIEAETKSDETTIDKDEKVTADPKVTELPVKLSTFQTVSAEVSSTVTEKVEPEKVSEATTISTTQTTPVTLKPKPTRKPTRPSSFTRPTYKPYNITRPQYTQSTFKPKPTKPIINTTRKPPYRPPPKRPSTKKPLPLPPRLNITILPQSTSSKPLFTRPQSVITYINTTNVKDEANEITTSKEVVTTEKIVAITEKIATTETTTVATTQKMATTEKIVTTEKVMTEKVPTTEKVAETEPTIFMEPITERVEKTTEATKTTDEINETTLDVTEKETVRPVTEADIPEPEVTTTSTEYPPFATWSSNSDATKMPERVTEAPTTTTEETWSPITPPKGWILLSTIAPKPETTVSNPETNETPTENAETTPQFTETEPSVIETLIPEPTTQATKITTFTSISEVATTTTTKMPTTITEAEPTVKVTEPPTTKLTEAPTTQLTEAPTKQTEALTKVTEAPTKLTEALTKVTEAPTKLTEAPTKSTEPTTTIVTSPTTVSTSTTTTEVTTTTDKVEEKVPEVTKPIQEFTVNVTLSPTVPTSTFSSVDNGTTGNETSTEGSTIAIETTTNATTTVETTTEFVNMSDYKNVCGRRLWQAPTGRIVGGQKSGFGMWPWQISLRQYRTSTYLHKCGAALLNENWAITAAHCVEHVPPSELLVRLGEHDLANEDEPYGFAERRVQIVASHPHFDPATFEYDLALLRFYEPVTFQPNILPVCVPDNDDDYVGRSAYVTGWGRLFDEGPLPSVLQEVMVPVINNSACEAMYQAAGYNEHIPNIFICAGRSKGGTDSCEGDSGGPMVLPRERDGRYVLGGVISWGIGCAEPNQPGVYTRISEFRDWINQILQF